MNLSVLKKVTLALALSLGAQTMAQADTYEPEALEVVAERVEQASNQGKQAVVIFDLDDTLINTRERNLRILRDFASQPEIQASHPEEAQKILHIRLNEIKYLLGDTLKGIGITDEALLKNASDFWLARFFTNEYCALDKQNLGAAKYARRLARAGAKIVYLTGRDVPRMETGTIENLKKNNFPGVETQGLLMMKPTAQMDDLQFKKESFVKIAEMGEVVGVFENEPANINAMAEAFPDATAVFLDTIHSPKPDIPATGISWVKDFLQKIVVRGETYSFLSEASGQFMGAFASAAPISKDEAFYIALRYGDSVSIRMEMAPYPVEINQATPFYLNNNVYHVHLVRGSKPFVGGATACDLEVLVDRQTGSILDRAEWEHSEFFHKTGTYWNCTDFYDDNGFGGGV